MKTTWISGIVALGLAAGGCAATASSGIKPASATVSCIACVKRMATAAVTRAWNGKTLCFCSTECEKRFVKNPENFPH